MQPFDAAHRFQRTAPGLFTGRWTPDWYQGRGVYGGLLAATLVRGVMDTVDDPARVPRSLTVHFCAPARQGPAVLRVREERRGSLVSHLSARLEQEDGAVVCFASATVAAGRARALHYQDAVMPKVVPFDDATPVVGDHPMLPAFARHLEFRFCGGAPPYAGAPEAHMAAWLRPRQPVTADAPFAAALLDAMPPAFFSRAEAPVAGASVDFTMHFLGRFPSPGLPGDAPWLLSTRSRWAAEGYSEELTEMWSQGGELVGQCRQLIAVMG
ncbi:MAG: thioesterase family protein [Deltaproteobacteria bacterium]|nr:thioesterase family protein [Deltaproteobacteria bacterium]